MTRQGMSQVMAILIGMVVLIIIAVTIIVIFSGNYGDVMENLFNTQGSSAVDLCAEQVKGYCEFHPGASWEQTYPDCTQHASAIYPDSGTTCPT